jgi:hypothetical protein
MEIINNGLFLGVLINLIFSTWIIPLYIGANREIGYGKSMLFCVFLTPLIGLIITLTSPKNDNPLKSNQYPLAVFLAFFVLLVLHYVLLLNDETIFFAFENQTSSIITAFFWLISFIISMTFNEVSKRNSMNEFLLTTIFPTIYLIYVGIIGKNPNILKAETKRKSENNFDSKKHELNILYESNLLDESEFKNKLSAIEQEITKNKIEEHFYQGEIYFKLKNAKDKGILTQSEFELKIKEQKEILTQEVFDMKHRNPDETKNQQDFISSKEYSYLQEYHKEKIIKDEEFESKSSILPNSDKKTDLESFHIKNSYTLLFIVLLLTIIYPLIIKFTFDKYFPDKIYVDGLKLFFWMPSIITLVILRKKKYYVIVLILIAILYGLAVSSRIVLNNYN